MKATEHITLVAALHIAWSLLLFVFGCIIFVLLGVSGIVSGEQELSIAAVAGAMMATTLLFITGTAGFVAAHGLLRRRSWARFMVMVLSAVWLLKVPFGTAMGIYSFYVLTRNEVLEEFQKAGG